MASRQRARDIRLSDPESTPMTRDQQHNSDPNVNAARIAGRAYCVLRLIMRRFSLHGGGFYACRDGS